MIIVLFPNGAGRVGFLRRNLLCLLCKNPFGQGWVSFSVYYTLVNGMTQPTVCLLLKYTGIFTSVLFFVSFSLPSTRVLKSLATDGIPLLALGLVVVKGFP